jgi:hypothetical protein
MSETKALPELTNEDKLAVRNIQYSFYLLRLQQEHVQQQMMNVSQLLQQKESDLHTKYGLDANSVLFDRDNLIWIEKQPA